MIEYSVIIACVIAALVGMQIYIKRGIQGRLRQASDEIGEQYAPMDTTSTGITTTLTSDVIMNSKLVPLKYPDDHETKAGQFVKDRFDLQIFGMETTTTLDETVKRSGSEEFGEFKEKLF